MSINTKAAAVFKDSDVAETLPIINGPMQGSLCYICIQYSEKISYSSSFMERQKGEKTDL
jgi:hypothetical protein